MTPVPVNNNSLWPSKIKEVPVTTSLYETGGKTKCQNWCKIVYENLTNNRTIFRVFSALFIRYIFWINAGMHLVGFLLLQGSQMHSYPHLFETICLFLICCSITGESNPLKCLFLMCCVPLQGSQIHCKKCLFLICCVLL